MSVFYFCFTPRKKWWGGGEHLLFTQWPRFWVVCFSDMKNTRIYSEKASNCFKVELCRFNLSYIYTFYNLPAVGQHGVLNVLIWYVEPTLEERDPVRFTVKMRRLFAETDSVSDSDMTVFLCQSFHCWTCLTVWSVINIWKNEKELAMWLRNDRCSHPDVTHYFMDYCFGYP